jgi:hypothetical protein
MKKLIFREDEKNDAMKNKEDSSHERIPML